MDTCLHIILLHFDIHFLDHTAYLWITRTILDILTSWTYDVLIDTLDICYACIYFMTYIGCLDYLFDDFLLQ